MRTGYKIFFQGCLVGTLMFPVLFAVARSEIGAAIALGGVWMIALYCGLSNADKSR